MEMKTLSTPLQINYKAIVMYLFLESRKFKKIDLKLFLIYFLTVLLLDVESSTSLTSCISRIIFWNL